MRSHVRAAAAVLAVLCLAVAPAPAAAVAAVQDEPADPKKIVAEIAGDWEFSMNGEVLPIEFEDRDGRLFGAPPGEMMEELKPVAGKPLCFDVTVSTNGDYYVLQFVRNDQGVIDKCLLSVMGMTLEGAKIKK